ncbi:NAD(P)/FAD-dependent oxidoreductase [Fimbriiglobus ruber]|uniref:Amine oxidase n=1 Tax=Fimbriiglobus ruber TaxID=1908690 RepID=A0A225E7Z1_9BACT|nr:NAD(P)/FAD-dependent oxidoreductase [Fimbriiglobus ruber]OWK46888.1 amine oxidase [Fimbriiglobus ruber]
MSEPTVAIIGAGPAGLTAAYQLTKYGIPVTVLEADPKYVGGISRTVRYNGFHFDIGGHRFFSKSKEIEDLWSEILPDDMLDRPRSSRIFYNGQFFEYPLKAGEALMKLGPIESARCVLSYLKARAFPQDNPRSFQDWVTNQFGARLFNIFFKTYTEKVWGMSCKEISADWAAQRIKGLSLKSAILNALWKPKPKARGQVIKSLINTFRYPRLGPGMLWEACAEKVKAQGGVIEMGRKVVGLHYDHKTNLWTVNHTGPDGDFQQEVVDHVISSAPMKQLIHGLSPRTSDAARDAASKLRYRDFLTVALVLKDRNQFTDNWIYIHDPGVKVGRVQNFKSWSPEMVPDQSLNCYGLEYFCFEGDGTWAASDADLIEMAKKELAKIGLADASDVLDGCVVRQPKAYPVYDDDYATHVATVRAELQDRFPNLHLVGRNGMHKYNNQDHAMMTAMLCAENIRAGREKFNLWEVNQDAEYHEAGSAGTQNGSTGLRMVPTRVKGEPQVAEEVVAAS